MGLPAESAQLSKRPVAIDVFSGCGGLTLGLRQAGFRVIGAVEIDPLAADTYHTNHSDVLVWNTDIRNLRASMVMQQLGLVPGELDLLAGCPPCQGFTTLRTHHRSREVADPRNDLVFEFLRLVREMAPKTVMMENVPNLATDARMARVLGELRELGYAVDHGAIRILDAAKYGVPQRRRRMILLAGRFGPIPFAIPDNNRLTVSDAIRNLPPSGQSGDALHDISVRRSERIMALIRSVPKNGGGRLELAEEHWLACHDRTNGFKDVYGRMAWKKPAPTITSGCGNPSKGRFLHPEEDRAITLREAALLQTFPESYFFSLRRGRNAVAAMIGNALPPEFVRRHARQVKSYLETTGKAV